MNRTISRRLLPGAAMLLALSMNVTAAEQPRLDEETRKSVLAALSAKVSAEYVFPDKAKRVVARLNEKEGSGAYRDLKDIEAFARALTADLREPTRDLHLGVHYSANVLPKDEGATPTPEQVRMYVNSIRAENYGVSKVENLPGNIGYIDLRSFDGLEYARPAIAAAMALVADADALIVDLRQNGGGDPNTVAFMSSYLFDKRTHLNDLYWRKGGRTEQFWTSNKVPGKKFGGKRPVYVLAGHDTFSAAEEFSYNLQQRKRATIVGETTGGGAHPGSVHRLHPHLSVFIPGGRAINPVSKTNWEGSGVTPDVPVAAADAPRTAVRLALQALMKSPRNEEHAQLLRNRLQMLDKTTASNDR
ncbi:S41 family peptidase [Massilia sp. Se16.2.3]|uniref:S41 family peptidase n=1 Tax=Massilia sp. Se16.2.3 TaxID=2709303 RepID=UPI0016001EBF|nr:S41 family peptidase [Massilia sp. Se16.2.3]QNB00311.1 S41 family peptidase [Massilia sp. Se16.2.3]